MELYGEISDAMTAQRVGVDDVAVLSETTESALARWRASGVSYVPGFGHRFHPVDPRAGRLLRLVDAAAASGVVGGRFAAIGRSVATSLGRGRPAVIPMNIDGATAVIYSELGLAPQLGRGLFVLSRSIGILAHAWEQSQQGGRIKGPMPPAVSVRYTGASPRRLPSRQGDSAGAVAPVDATA
jgi:citrate synthase